MTTRNRPWRQEIELIQNYPKHHGFTKLLANNDSSQEIVIVSNFMEECNKISFIVETGDVHIAFDEEATLTTMLIPENEGYFDDSVYIGSTIKAMRAAGQSGVTPRIRGIIWGR